MGYSLTFEINALPKMTNPSGARSTHWRRQYNEARKWQTFAMFHAHTKGKPKKPLKQAKIVLTWFSSSAPDYDGLVSGFKSILDGLVKGGVLADDKILNIGVPEYKWEKAEPKQGKVKIEVYEV